MHSRLKTKKPSKASRTVRWEIEVIPWAMGIGMLLGFLAEVTWHGNVLWMVGGGIAGGLIGAVCDTALFSYRHVRRKRATNK
jgi:hypothetical protein